MASRVKTITAPVGGWDVRSALADMPEDRASLLDNWFPGVGRVDVRNGYSSYATGLGGTVETLAEFINGPVRKFIAGANNKIWNITAAGAGSDITNGMTITNDRWQTANMDGKMGLVNGADAPLEIAADGVTVSTMTLSGGMTAANVIGINVFSGRSYFWEDNSQSFWYSAVNALGGACTEFDLSRVGQFGGKLLAMGTWTRDGGSGVNDLAAFFMTSGEVLVYNGTNPSDFTMVGVFKIGAPVSIRGVIKLAGDLIVITKDGYIPLESVIKSGRLGDTGTLSNQINPAVTDAVTQFGSNFGWECFHYPRGNMLMFNVPLSANTKHQHVFNTNTGAPTRFLNINASTWSLYNDKAYFGSTGGVVYLFDDGFDDNGSSIDCDAIPANTYLDSKANQKLVTAVQAVASSDGALALSLKTEPDYKTPTVGYNSIVFAGGEADWDTATWDVSPWSSGNNITDNWVSMGAFGYSFQTRVRLRTKGQAVNWYSLNYMYEPAGLI